MKRLKRRLHKESAIHRHDSDTDVPVTEQEKLLCKYIPDEIEEFCAKNGLEVTCGANWHNPGEEQHIEIFVGIPEGEDNNDPKYDNIEVNLEMLVNGIGDAENEGEKWGDASFQWISDEEIFGELWPLEQSQVNESSKKMRETEMKKLNITKEQFNRSNYFQRKYGKLKYVSESGRLFKTSMGKVLKFVNEGGLRGWELEQDLDSLQEQCEYGNMSFNEVERTLIGLGFKLDEGGSQSGRADDDNQWMVYEHPEGYCVRLTYRFEGSRGSKRASTVMDFDWNIDDKIKMKYNESKKFGKKFGKKFMKESFYGIEGAKDVDWAIIYKNCHIEPSEFYGNLGELYDQEHPEDPNHEGFDDWCWENRDLIESELEHLASYDDNYEGDPYYKESRKKFVNEGSGDQQEEFSYKGVVISRYDYESLPMPMAASKLDDETMQKIAEDIYYMLLDHGWEDKDIDRYLGRNLDEMEDENDRDANMIKEDFWEYMENAAVANGMEYYSEMEDGDEYMESKKFGKKFHKMDESMNWNGVTDKFIDNDNVQFTRKCPSCGKPHSITVPIHDVEYGCSAYDKGASIQDAFPNFSPDEREFFMSGICPNCW